MPGLPVKPGTVTPSGPALSKARVLLGEQVMRRIFEIDAARSDAELGISTAWHGMEVTGIDGTTIELFSCDELAQAFGVPTGGTKPKIRIAAHVRHRVPAGGSPPRSAATTTGRTPWPMSWRARSPPGS